MDRTTLILDILEAQGLLENVSGTLKELLGGTHPVLSKDAIGRVIGTIDMAPLVDFHLTLYSSYSMEELETVHAFVTSDIGRRMG